MAGRRNSVLRTTQRSFELIEELIERDGARITELAGELGTSKSTIHNHLNTLHHGGYVLKEGQVYYPSLKFLEMGGRTRNRLKLYRKAKPEARRLATEIDFEVRVVTEELNFGVDIYHTESNDRENADSYVGLRSYLHTTAFGKAILAQKTKREMTDLVNRCGLPARTDDTIVDINELSHELQQTRERGFAVESGERLEGFCSVAAPIASDETTFGAIGICALSTDISEPFRNEDWIEQIVETATIIGLNMRG